MSTLNLSAARIRGDAGALGRAVAGALEKITAHRQAKANAFVRPYLARLSDGELEAMGYGRDEIAKIKAAGEEALPYHI